jgi:hypothetical protein
MKTLRRRKRLDAVVLMAYLSAIASGGLHHHEHDSAFTATTSTGSGSQLTPSQICSGSPAASTSEDDSCCTLCTALHQAKALAPVVCLAGAYHPAGEAAIISEQTPIISHSFTSQARAPPT